MASQGIYWFDSEGDYVKVEFSTNMTDSPLTFTEVSEVKGVSANPEASPEIDFTHYASVEQELRVGLPRRGSYDITCNFVPDSSSQETIMTLNNTKEARRWRIRYPQSDVSHTVPAEERFDGYVQTASIAPPGAQDTTPVDFNFTLRVAGSYLYQKEAA